MRSRIALLAIALLTAMFFVACDAQPVQDAQKSEAKTNEENYENLVENQPAETMDYAPTREGINKFTRTWEEQGKISYVYIINQSGVNYLVLEGLPISYCASMTPPEKYKQLPDDGDYTYYPHQSPSMDGVYYSGSNCIQYYGFEAQTDTYVEFSVGGDQNFYVSEKPLPKFADATPIGNTTISDVKK